MRWSLRLQETLRSSASDHCVYISKRLFTTPLHSGLVHLQRQFHHMHWVLTGRRFHLPVHAQIRGDADKILSRFPFLLVYIIFFSILVYIIFLSLHMRHGTKPTRTGGKRRMQLCRCCLIVISYSIDTIEAKKGRHCLSSL